MTVNGSKTEWTGMENSITARGRLRMKGSGSWMSSMARGKSIMIIPPCWISHSTILTLIIWRSSGYIMKGRWKMILRKGMGPSCSKTGNGFKDNSTRTGSTGRESSLILRVNRFMESGHKAS